MEEKTLIWVWLRGADCDATLAQPNMDGRHASLSCTAASDAFGNMANCMLDHPEPPTGGMQQLLVLTGACGNALDLGRPMQLVRPLSNQVRIWRPGPQTRTMLVE